MHAKIFRFDQNIISGDDFVGASQTLDAFLKHHANEREVQGGVQATQHREGISKEDLEKLFSFFYSEGSQTHESWHKPSGSSWHAISDSVPGR